MALQRKGEAMSPATATRFNRLVVVSYRLPYKFVTQNGQTTIVRNAGGLVSAMTSLTEKMPADGSSNLYENALWVGRGDLLPGAGNTNGQPQVPNDPENKFQLVPVSIDKEIDDKYYGGFCNDLIWPLFHYFPSLVVHNESYFESYSTANRLFAEKLAPLIKPDDFIWIHDYQLFLLPDLLRKIMPSANIGFFLHIPFPSFEIFRIMPHRWRDAILKGILGADLVGFHTNDYSQYFLHSVSRLLGYEVTMNTATTEDRIVKVDAFPIGIDYEKFNTSARTSKEIEAERQKILATLNNQKLIFSIDRLDYSKGLLQRLEAYECFLETYPEWIEKAVFNMVVIPSRDTIPQYQNMKREIEASVGRINGKYSTIAWRPIIYQYKSLSFNEMVALYDLSLVGLITPIRDGMNLVAKEYVACQITEKGVLILSEMAGAAAELSETILINPTDKRDVADAINKALSMSLRERTIILARMQRRIKNYTVFRWARDILENLESIKKEQAFRSVTILTPAIESQIITRYRNASNRAIFLDYDGTLVPFSKIPELAIPGPQTIAQLNRLSENSKNSVVLISGRDKSFLEEWFGSLSINLIAEHGAFHRPLGREWKCAIDPDQGWKSPFSPILQRYTTRCNGSFVEEKYSSLAWHYRNSPPEIGRIKAKELKDELRTLVAHESKLQVLEGNMVIEVKKAGYDKGIAALKFISKNSFDFIITLGDDKTDEDIFQALPLETVTIKIGMTNTIAKYNISNQSGVSQFLDKLIECER
jgi:trehalose 6-phosphate synthase/phosphatase